MSKFARLIILYNPTIKELERTLDHCNQFDRTYIFDNSLKSVDRNERFYSQEIKLKNHIKYIPNYGNDGLATSYNKGMQMALNENINWLMLFDQDSIIYDSSIMSMKKFAGTCDINEIAIIAPYINYKGKKSTYKTESASVKWVINSGALLNIRLLQKNHIIYDEAYFIDRLDKDFCMQVCSAGYSIVQIQGAELMQSLGYEKNGVRIHSPIRNYYMFRNRLYFNRKYYKRLIRWGLNSCQTLKQLFNIISSKNEIHTNFTYFLKAVNDYYNNKMGRIDHE